MTESQEDRQQMAKRDRQHGSIGERLKLFLDLHGLSASAFAVETKIPDRTIRNYVAGKSQPGADHLVRMAAAGLDLTWLLTGGARAGFESLFLDEVQGEEVQGDEAVIAADDQLYEVVVSEAFMAADGYMERRRAESRGPLTAFQTALVVSLYCRIILMWAAKNLKMIKKSGGVIKDEETLREVFRAPVGAEYDYNIDKLLPDLPSVPRGRP